jgi:RimJ/RimL family protein N-acetyltransferase
MDTGRPVSMPGLRSARLEFRPLTAKDFDLVARLSSDPRVMAPLGGTLSATESRAWLERQLEHFRAHGYGRYVVTRDAQFVGFVGLSRTDFERGIVPGIEIAWRLAFEQWGHGYATEAARTAIEEGFSRFEIEEVIAVASVDNLRSRSVMVRLGMTYSPSDTFGHPRLSADDPLRRHVVYRLLRR